MAGDAEPAFLSFVTDKHLRFERDSDGLDVTENPRAVLVVALERLWNLNCWPRFAWYGVVMKDFINGDEDRLYLIHRKWCSMFPHTETRIAALDFRESLLGSQNLLLIFRLSTHKQ